VKNMTRIEIEREFNSDAAFVGAPLGVIIGGVIIGCTVYFPFSPISAMSALMVVLGCVSFCMVCGAVGGWLAGWMFAKGVMNCPDKVKR
jgi:hypothetical protein